MKNNKVLFAILGVLLLLTVGAVGYSLMGSGEGADKQQEQVVEEDVFEILPDVDESVLVDVTEAVKANSIMITVEGMDGNYESIAYELTYESEGLVKGVNSGSKPIEVSGEDGFEREVFLGTCSRNVCTADEGVSEVSVVVEFTDSSGERSQFSGDFSVDL